MAEDIFGLSLRGLTTLRDILVRPAKVFEAARAPDWKSRYTPSIRLATSLVALMLLLRFFWAGKESAMFQSVLAQINQLARTGADIPDPATLATNYFNAWVLVFPVVYLAVHFLFALLLRIWGKEASTVTRLRLYFIALIPGLLVATISLLAIPLAGVENLFALSAAYMGACALAYGLGAYFGLKDVYIDRTGRLWRALVFVGAALTADTVASLLSSVLGSALGTLVTLPAS
jgi:hypothetical protein